MLDRRLRCAFGGEPGAQEELAHELEAGVTFDASPLVYFAFIPLILLVMLLPVTFNGIGTGQAAFVWFFAQAGVPAASAFALSRYSSARRRSTVRAFFTALPPLAVYVTGRLLMRPEGDNRLAAYLQAAPGDIAKAFGAGADFVMLGGMLAGHDECAGEVIERSGTRYKRFYGMSSRVAMEKYAGGVADYRAAEGKEVLVELRGPVANTVGEILGGVRSACTYVGARTLRELTKRTTFVRVSASGSDRFEQPQ